MGSFGVLCFGRPDGSGGVGGTRDPCGFIVAWEKRVVGGRCFVFNEKWRIVGVTEGTAGTFATYLRPAAGAAATGVVGPKKAQWMPGTSLSSTSSSGLSNSFSPILAR
jgi:hypothetical protein